MQLEISLNSPWRKKHTKTACFLWATALVFTACVAMPRTSAAAEINLSGKGTFKPPSAEQLAALPADLGFSRSDLASGNWSFFVRYDDSVPGAASAPYVGRYAGTIRAFRLVIGSATVNLPVDQAEIVISDGGASFANRESIRVEAKAAMPSGILRLSWVEVNQQVKGVDLRGPTGLLPSVQLPPYAMVANLPTVSPYDRFLELRVDRPGGDPRPLLYLSSSQLSVTADPATAP
jgi:hypothetical protein